MNCKILTHDKEKTLMTKTFKINEEIDFYNNKIEQENFKRIEKEIFQKLDQIPYPGNENRNLEQFKYEKESKITGSTKLFGTTTENHIEAVKNQIDEIRKQIEENNR